MGPVTHNPLFCMTFCLLPLLACGGEVDGGASGDGPAEAFAGDAGDKFGNASPGRPGRDAGVWLDASVPEVMPQPSPEVDADVPVDTDGDGLTDAEEAEYGTDPEVADSDGDGLADGDEVAAGTDPTQADSDGDGFTDGEEAFLGTDPTGGDAAGCAADEAQASETDRPVDVIVIIDNSSSMDGEIAAIQDRINEDFGDILDDAGVDWRVILLSRHGAVGHDQNGCDDNGICIQGDLAGGTVSCDANAAPANTDRFKHYSICINSEDGLAKAAASFDESPPGWAGGFQASAYFDAGGAEVALTTASTGWHSALRAGALRTFLMISDDKSASPHADFTSWMYSKDASFFGTAEEPNWVFHSIIAVQAKAAATDPWLPHEPVIDQDCGQGSAEIGYDYQELSIQSGGLRFPICENGNFDAVFRAVAAKVVESSTIPCTLEPDAIEGAGDPDFSRTIVVYEAGDGSRVSLEAVAGADACSAGDYYVDDTRIELCPDRCETIAADSEALVRLRVACAPVCGNGVLEDGEECDDGNGDGGDACSPSCTVENLCGNGELDEGEECDDGNLDSGDGCTAGCQREDGCGDGALDVATEECDDDNLIDGDGCSKTCQREMGCGDGVIQAGEFCDDDNITPGDGCDENCQIEVL